MSGTGRYAPMSAAQRERVMGVAFGLFRLALRDRDAGARRQRRRQVPARRRRDTASSAQRRAAVEIAARQRGLRPSRCDLHRRHGAGHSAAARPPRSRPAPPQHRRRPGPRQPTLRSRRPGELAQLRGGLDGRVGRGPGRARVTLVRQHVCPGRRGRAPSRHIVSCLGLGRPARRIVRRLRPDRPASSVPIPRHQRHAREPNRSPIASARSRPSSAAARAAIGSPAIAAAICLPGEDLAQPPPVAQLRGPGRSPRRSTAAATSAL